MNPDTNRLEPLEVHDAIEESLKRICEFIVKERDQADADGLSLSWHNRVSYLAHTTLRVYRRGVEAHHELSNLARSGVDGYTPEPDDTGDALQPSDEGGLEP